ncbi:MAG: tetratricopeptide repeat protein [Candidatus Thiodiazotropha lotti]|nr:tetratricopeptide repeat protein [Candidatus Thiodiazotropha lotti]MCG8001492.1 tetratricopeptide repeat protein [Candidatus Thiodiazotropha lotti]MCW4184111.1 tetratricopeptide repeat protein [Candidatus Thiodiazotropha weberae]MCW4193266.1 tetratricopeptide repeat protein [Candidatus Thiodiazotropha weberae]
MPNNLSTAIKKLNQGKLAEAGKLFSRVIKKDPTNGQAQYLLGQCLLRQNRNQEAALHLQQAISMGNPEPCLYYLCGMALEKSGQFQEAEKSYEIAERLGCSENLMYYMIGSFNANITQNFAKAEVYFGKTITNDPNAYVAYVALSKLYNDQGRYEDALQALDYCLTHGYETVEVYVNLGHALSHQGRQEEALACCKKSVELAPDHAVAQQNYLAQLLFSLDNEAEIYPEIAELTKPLNARVRKKYAGEMNCQLDRKLTLGFVSADLIQHAIVHYFMPVLKHLNKDRFTIILYSNNIIQDQTSNALENLCDVWVNCSQMDDKHFQDKIRTDQVDILIDLSNNTAGNRLTAFLNRPAPMQVSMMGLQMSTGLNCMDYALRDKQTAEKCQLDQYSSEKILPVENSAFFDPLMELPPVAPPPCISNGYITFGSFNGLRKIDKSVMEVWAKLLNAVPGSRIRLMTDDYENKYMRDYLHEIFSQFQVDQNRLQLQPRLSLGEFLTSHNEVDIALDPYPYHGESTTYYSLLMGLPLVTRAGNSCASNVSNRILAAINREQWVANDFDEYIEIALSLAKDVDGLIANRNSLRTDIENSSLMNFKLVTENIESALLIGWQTLCDERKRES